MPKFPEAREALLHAHADNLLDDEDFLLLTDLNTSKNPDLEYWNYDPFDLRSMPDAECFTEMRFWKNDIYRLANALNTCQKKSLDISTMTSLLEK